MLSSTPTLLWSGVIQCDPENRHVKSPFRAWNVNTVVITVHGRCSRPFVCLKMSGSHAYASSIYKHCKKRNVQWAFFYKRTAKSAQNQFFKLVSRAHRPPTVEGKKYDKLICACFARATRVKYVLPNVIKSEKHLQFQLWKTNSNGSHEWFDEKIFGRHWQLFHLF